MKVLIISHLPIATQNNMGKTFLSLFSEFRREELCQMYIYPAIPDVDRCASFYRVTDKDVLRALPFGKPGGEIQRERIRENAGLYENPEDEHFYRDRRNKSAVRRLLRDAMWDMSRWDNDRLAAWLDREKPDCLFVSPGAARFVYDFALRIARSRDIPILVYICDEYYFVQEPSGPLDRLRLGLLKKKMETLMAHCAHAVTICDELRDDYARHFGVEATTLMTGASCAVADGPRVAAAADTVSYFGNIRCNRYLSLAEVGRALDRINEKTGSHYRLRIYTSEKDPGILGTFSDIRSVELPGFLTGAAFAEAFHDAQLLLHVEAFDEDSIDYVRHSMSTKIADSLASGIPLLAYGPGCVASMGHLLRHDCALTATDPAELEAMLTAAFAGGPEVRRRVDNALAVARRCHDSRTVSGRLRELVEAVIHGGA